MNNPTERGMWQVLDDAAEGLGILHRKLTRVETGLTALGVSDVEYVMGVAPTVVWHGWVELKVCTTQRDKSRLAFGHEFTLQQALWLGSHHTPVCYLRSWLLVGFPGPVHWREFLLFTAPSALRVVSFSSRAAPTLGHLRKLAEDPLRSGIFRCATAAEVVQLVARGGTLLVNGKGETR